MFAAVARVLRESNAHDNDEHGEIRWQANAARIIFFFFSFWRVASRRSSFGANRKLRAQFCYNKRRLPQCATAQLAVERPPPIQQKNEAKNGNDRENALAGGCLERRPPFDGASTARSGGNATQCVRSLARRNEAAAVRRFAWPLAELRLAIEARRRRRRAAVWRASGRAAGRRRRRRRRRGERRTALSQSVKRRAKRRADRRALSVRRFVRDATRSDRGSNVSQQPTDDTSGASSPRALPFDYERRWPPFTCRRARARMLPATFGAVARIFTPPCSPRMHSGDKMRRRNSLISGASGLSIVG